MSRRKTLWGCAVLALGLLLEGFTARAAAQELRALWVDAFHAGFRSSSEVTQLIADARAGNFNAVIVEVRKRGDAYYSGSIYEPKATDVSPAGFDPLADLIAKGHDTNAGPRIEIHCWIVTFPVWNNVNTGAAPASHVVRQHPEWLSKTDTGTNWVSGVGNYQLDPGHPGVLQHNYNVAMDIISRYDVDGLNFDYVRYPGNNWGYNDVAVARFNARFGRTGQPARTDPDWLQFRRDQVSALVRKVYLNALALKPRVKLSADTICFAPGVTTAAGWTNSAAAYTSVLQDWRAWMEEGILDLSIPMAYFDQGGQYAPAWTNWNTFARNHRYNRHTAIGPGIYLNSVSNALFQMRFALNPSGGGGPAANGVCGYSYAVTSNDGVPRATFLAALTQTNTARLYDPHPAPLFVNRATPPDMPWKTSPTRGHLMGFARSGTDGIAFDGATITLAGPTNRTLLTDATGFYGAVDLPAGNYSVTAMRPGFLPRTTNVTIAIGVVATRDFTLPPDVPPALANVQASPSSRAAIITWTTTNASSSQVEYGFTSSYGMLSMLDPTPVTNHSVLLWGLAPGSNYYFGVVSRAGTNTSRSDGWAFSTAGELILDNTAATFTGAWTVGPSSPDKFGDDYRYATISTNGPTANAVFTPDVPVRGFYDVFIWYPQGGNRSTNASVTIVPNGSAVILRLNQTIGGGGWRQIGTNLSFLRGTSGFVRFSNSANDAGKVVMADAVRLVYRPEQDAPTGPTAPDWWTSYYFGAAVNSLPDHDGDGYPTWMEYLAGTVPTNAASRLRLRLEVINSVTLRAGFSPALPGRRYGLDRKFNLAEPWLMWPTPPVFFHADGEGSVTISNAFTPQVFHRLGVNWAD